MNITITINTDNTAFEGDNLGFEIGRILHELATKVVNGAGLNLQPGDHIALRDTNGNTVGAMKVRR